MKQLTRDLFQYRMCADNNGRKGSFTIRKKLVKLVNKDIVISKSPNSAPPTMMFADVRRNSTSRLKD